MALSTLRDTTVVLIDYTNYTPWLNQTKSKCQSLRIWDLIDPSLSTQLMPLPELPQAPKTANYQLSTQLIASNTNDEGELTPPSLTSHLSTAGLKAFKDDHEYYKGLVDEYKMVYQKYLLEQGNLDKANSHIQSSVSIQLQNTCCIPDESLRQWMIRLKDTVGIDDEDKYRRARTRYLLTLKPLKTLSNWHIWLTEYDQAATEAKVCKVQELKHLSAVKEDFIAAVIGAAP